jgi:AcrR family transcriptional regulator
MAGLVTKRSTHMSESESSEVRPRSSHRKRRAGSEALVAREPSQDRSRKRRAAILEAAERLLQTRNIEAISHSEIATEAGVSKASVHYHFPTSADIQLEVGRFHQARLAELLEAAHERLAAMRIPTWQEWIRIEAAMARDYFNGSRPACEALLGPILNRESRLGMFAANERDGLRKLSTLTRLFDIPNQALVETIFKYHGEMIDLFWSEAYLDRGFIDDETLEDSLRACIGYLRNFLPEVLVFRDPPGTSAG